MNPKNPNFLTAEEWENLYIREREISAMLRAALESYACKSANCTNHKACIALAREKEMRK